MKKYSHSKSPNSLRSKVRRNLTPSKFIPRALRDKEIRKIANHRTVERQFGYFRPKFGSTLGVDYDGSTGAISKVRRYNSVS